jgi:uncharacterized protein (TIGR02996 family)
VLVILYHRPNERSRRHVTEQDDIVIGRSLTSDFVLSDISVSRRHCRLAVSAGGFVIQDLGSTNGTTANGAEVHGPVEVRPGAALAIGAFKLTLGAPEQPRSPVEDGLLQAIGRGDDASRLVYADWLEEHGDAVRAEFLRVQQAIIEEPMGTPAERAAFLARSRRLSSLAERIEVTWRKRVARPAVEGCQISFEIPCKMDWGALTPTARPDVRTCNTCRKEVRYFESEREAIEHAARGHCVVVDINVSDVTCDQCGNRNPARSPACFGCGVPIQPSIRTSRQSSRAAPMMAGMMMIPPPASSRRDSAERRVTPCRSCGAGTVSASGLCPACGGEIAGRGRPR